MIEEIDLDNPGECYRRGEELLPTEPSEACHYYKLAADGGHLGAVERLCGLFLSHSVRGFEKS